MAPALPSAASLLAGCPTPLALLVDGGTISACTVAWGRILGGEGPLAARLAPEDGAALPTHIADARAASAPVTITVRPVGEGGRILLTLWKADERALWVSAAPAIAQDEAPKARLLLAVFEVMNAILWSCDRDGRLLVSEGRGLVSVGIEAGQQVGMNIHQLYAPEAPLLEDVRRVLAGESIVLDDMRLGTHWYRIVTPMRDARGDITGVHGCAINLEGGGSLLANAKHLADAVRHLPLAIWAIDMNGTCTMVEGELLAQLGTTPEGLLGKNLFAMFEASHTTVVTDALRRALGGEDCVTEHTTGKTILRTRYVPLRESLGNVVGVCAVTEDTTAQRLLESQLREQLELVESQRRAIAELSTPIIEVWQDVVAVPVVGSLDPARAEHLLAALLSAVVERRASFALLDLTGVEAVDTATAQSLVRLIEAVSLVGCEGLITGIRPSVADTLVALGVDLSRIRTLRSLKDALRFCASRQRGAAHVTRPA